MPSDLTILCVTANRPYAQPFLDAMGGIADALGARFVEFNGRDAGCIENVLDQAVAACPGGYILRLDDDERMSRDMELWLFAREYRAHDHWAFPRMNLWPDENSYIVNHNLWPDPQTRLSTKEKSGGRYRVHEGSPYGTGQLAPCVIEHHKFLVRTEAERRRLVADYEAMQPGAGSAFVQFSLPEALKDLQIEVRETVAA